MINSLGIVDMILIFFFFPPNKIFWSNVSEREENQLK